MAEHYTKENDVPRTAITVEEARRAHHLASADPEVEGVHSGLAHEVKYSLERAGDTAAAVELGIATQPLPHEANILGGGSSSSRRSSTSS